MMVEIPREPTPDECVAQAALGDGWYACWYPQMGGYVGRAALRVEPLVRQSDDGSVQEGGCFEVYVWHDGAFPFSDGDLDDWEENPKHPAHLHHCSAGQFVEFGRFAQSLGAD